MKHLNATRRAAYVLTPVTLACVLAACGDSGNGSGSTSSSAVTYSGKVVATAVTATTAAAATGNPVLTAGYYKGATVFVDTNGNGKLDSGEASTITDANGAFTLTLPAASSGQIVADIPTTATNTASGATVASHLILRASYAQITDQGATSIVISPLSTEVQRMAEANGTTYAAEKANLAARLSGPVTGTTSSVQGTITVAAADVVSDVNTLSGAKQYALEYESNALTNRYTYATAKFDRGDKYPDALAVAGNDPRLSSISGVSSYESTVSDTRTAITYAQSQQAAFNIEGVPAYDNIFIIVEENKSTDALVGNTTYAPYINQLLGKYNQLTTYFATGYPSEPNYTALGGGDDWGIRDDNWYGCGATGANVPTDVAFAGGTASDGQPLVATTATPTNTSALAGYSATAGAACSTSPAANLIANHNEPGDNLFTLIHNAGLTIRTYSESMNPGQDPRVDSVGDTAVAATYSETDPADGTTVTGTTGKTLNTQLYRVKHGPSIAYQTARNLPEFYADNRTLFNLQYADVWKNSTAYTIPTGYNYDQFSTDLTNGDVGNINFVIPDQCDDMHGVGTDVSCTAVDDNGHSALVKRGDIYLANVIKKIQASKLWNNPKKRVAIVVMFDEGEPQENTVNGVLASAQNSSCCGWNPGGLNSGAAPVTVVDSSSGGVGVATATTAPYTYAAGNYGHGNSIFSVITNQQDLGNAAGGIKDSDTYSHFSFVRTLQDMFQLADPAKDSTYLNRAKYTEAFILSNLTALPEFADSADTHFDSVRPINHAYVIPNGYEQPLNPGDSIGIAAGTTAYGTGDTVAAPAVARQIGADSTQTNVWSLTK